MRISRRLAWTILVSAILTAALLRQFNEKTPESAFLPWPVRSLLFFLLVILFLVFLRGWGSRQEFPYAGRRLEAFNLLAMVPLLIALTGEKWFSITFYRPILEAAAMAGIEEAVLGALQEVLAGLGILLVVLALLPLFPRLRPLLREYLSARSLLLGLAGTLTALAGVYVIVGAGLLLLGGENVHLYPRWFGSWAGIRFSGQALIALGEEFYYRGLLQTELIFLLPALGLRRPVMATTTGIGLIALQFALEHVAPGDRTGEISIVIYSMTVALLLGAMLVSLRSLYFCALTHFFLNLFVLGGGLQYTDSYGRPLLDPGIYVTLYMIVVILLIYARYGPERHEINVRRRHMATQN